MRNKLVIRIIIMFLAIAITVPLFSQVVFAWPDPPDNADFGNIEVYDKMSYTWDGLNEKGKKITGINSSGFIAESKGTGSRVYAPGVNGAANDWNDDGRNWLEFSSAINGPGTGATKFKRALESQFVHNTKDRLITWSTTLPGLSSIDSVGGDNVFVYAYATKQQGATKDATDWAYLLCDWSNDKSCFIYYYFSHGCSNPGDDNMTVCVFYSTEFVYPEKPKGDAVEEQSDYKETANVLLTILNNMTAVDGTDIFAGLMTDAADVKFKRRINQINSIVSLGIDNNGKREMMFKSFHKLNLYHDRDDYKLSIDISYTSPEGIKIQEGVYVELGNKDYIAYGDSNELTGGGFQVVSPSSDFEGMFAEFCASLLNSFVNNSTGISDAELQELLDNWYFGAKGTFTYELISAYKDAIMDAIKNSTISNDYSNPANIKFRSSEPFDIVQEVLKYNIYCLANNSSMVDVLTLPDTTLMSVASNGTLSGGAAVSVKDYWGKLNGYQKAILGEEYDQKLKVLGLDSHPNKYTFVSFDFNGDKSKIDYSNQDLDMTSSLVKKYRDSDLYNTGNAVNVARVCNVATQYVFASALYSNSNATAEGIYAVYNSNLDKLAEAQWLYEDGQKDWLSYMPRGMRIFDGDKTNSNVGDSEGYAAFDGDPRNWTRLAAILYNVEYAFEIMAKSAYGEEDLGSSVNKLRAFFRGDENSVAPGGGGQADAILSWMQSTAGLDAYSAQAVEMDFNNEEFSINLFRSIIELHDMCEFLGINIGDWSEVIDGYLGIYEDNKVFFEFLRNNNNIYAMNEKGTISVDEPLGMFFSVEDKSMSEQWAKGFALSALYVPMETNLYDAESVVFLDDTDWVSDFYYKYAFYRKALYINTDSSAIVNNFVTGEVSSTRVATLKDLLNYDRDIILTLDDNFYNARDIDKVIDRMDYSAVRNSDSEDVESTATGWDKAKEWASGLIDLDAGSILKTGSTQYYSTKLADKATKLNNEPNPLSLNYDAYLLSNDEILGSKDTPSALDDYEYSVKQSYAVVSAIYRNANLYNTVLNSLVVDNAIFKSSKSICSTPGTNWEQWKCIYNYYMLANLEQQIKNDATSTLDVDAPIFCDLFGNIVTESGLVIIPAATNATLCNSTWTPYTIGWSEYYNNGKRIHVDELNDEVYSWLLGREYTGATTTLEPQLYTDLESLDKAQLGGLFVLDSSGDFILRTAELTSNNLTGIVQFNSINKNSTVVKQLLFNVSYFNKAKKCWSYTLVNLVVETLRGAPIENIDYSYEAINTSKDISKFGVFMAYKLEETINGLTTAMDGVAIGGNSLVTMPNLAYVSGVEYVMLYVFKLVFAGLIVGLVIQLYFDAISNSLGIKSVGKFIMTCMLVIAAFTGVPELVSVTYYDANKDILAEESGYIMMLNYVKEYDGAEIGITSVETPETTTKLYVQVDDVSVKWWKIIPDVLFGNTIKSVSQLYKEQTSDSPIAAQKNVQLKGNGLYMDVMDIFNSTYMSYVPNGNYFVNYTLSDNPNFINKVESTVDKSITNDSDTIVSFVTPYYVILDQLIRNVNEYNLSRDVSAYSWNVGKNGNILTYDLLSPYLTSSEFLDEGFDILALERICGTPQRQLLYNCTFSDRDIEKMTGSLWYPTGKSESFIVDHINNVYDYARDYVANNIDVLGKVPDEVFLKVMALQIAIRFNQEFNVSDGAAIEIMNIDTRDLMRFMVGDRGSIYKYYAYNFPRYCYEVCGGFGCLFAMLLVAAIWVSSFVKPLMMIVILGILIVNVVGRKLVLRKESNCIEGYLIGCACLCLCNYAYAFMLKISFSIPAMGLGSVTALVFAVGLQIAYICGLGFICKIEIKDWKNNGYSEFQNIGAGLLNSVHHAVFNVSSILARKNNEAYNTSMHKKHTHTEVDIGDMLERDKERERVPETDPSFNIGGNGGAAEVKHPDNWSIGDTNIKPLDEIKFEEKKHDDWRLRAPEIKPLVLEEDEKEPVERGGGRSKRNRETVTYTRSVRRDV